MEPGLFLRTGRGCLPLWRDLAAETLIRQVERQLHAVARSVQQLLVEADQPKDVERLSCHGAMVCNLLRPLIKTLFLLVPYGCVIVKIKKNS